MNINELVLKTMKEIDLEKVITDSIKKNVECTVDKVIREVYGSRWGEFGKAFEQHLIDSMAVNFNSLDLKQYNEVIFEKVKQGIKNKVNDISSKCADKMVEKLLITDMYDEYDFSDIIQKFVEANDLDDFSLHIDCMDNSGLVFIYLDERWNTPDYLCKYRIYIDNNRIKTLKFNDKTVSTILTMQDDFELFLCNIFLQGKKINFDYGYDIDSYLTIADNDECGEED